MGTLGKRPNKHYAGSTTGDSLWPVTFPKMEDLWKLSVAEKKNFYEKAARANAPPNEEEGEVEGGQPPDVPPRQPGDIEPMSFWSSDDKLYCELMHRVSSQAVIDLTATDGQFALSAIKAGVPYLGVCQTAPHAEGMAKWLTSSVFRLFLQEGSPLHKPSLAEVVGSGDPSSVEGPAQTAEPRPNALQRTRARAKASSGHNARAVRAAKRAAKARASHPPAQEEQVETAGEGDEEEQVEEDQEGDEGQE